MPLHPVVETIQPVDPEARAMLHAAAACDGEMDHVVGEPTRPLGGSTGGDALQCCGFVEKDAAPGPLEPRRTARVLDEDAVMQPGQLPSPDQTCDVVRCESGLQELASADHSGLCLQLGGDAWIHPADAGGRSAFTPATLGGERRS